MSKLIIRKAEYNYSTLKPIIYEIMDSSGMDMIQKESRVLIKPNLLAPASPDKAIVTHPLIVKAVAEYVIERGAVPQISDSPAIGSFEKILKESGIKDALEGLNVVFKEFKESVIVDAGKPFKKIEIARDVIDADIIINLPKLKTHVQMMLTLGIKNLFGCIVGMKKPEWHLRAGVDKEMFASMLVKVFKTANPAVTIMDGILAMEGQGPGKSGEPRELGFILGGRDTVAIDRTACKILGIDPDAVLTNRIAGEDGLTSEEIIVDGEMPQIKDFKFPEMSPVVFGPKRFHGLIRRHIVQRPVADESLCRMCGECWQYCPAEAITKSEKNISFDYEKCIRCYCCIEVCPHGALSARETMPGKVARKILKL